MAKELSSGCHLGTTRSDLRLDRVTQLGESSRPVPSLRPGGKRSAFGSGIPGATRRIRAIGTHGRRRDTQWGSAIPC